MRVSPFTRLSKLALCGLALLATQAAASTAFARPAYRLTVPQTLSSIDIDGHLDEVSWEGGVMTYGFFKNGSRLERADLDTRARLTYHYGALYMAFTSEIPEGGEGADAVGFMLEIPTAEGSAKRFELWIDSDHQLFDGDPSADGEILSVNGVKSAIRERRNAWDVELMLPYAALGVDSPKVGDVWRANFLRRRSGGERDHASRWVTEADWGELRFGRSTLVYAWSEIPFVSPYEIMVYNPSDSVVKLRAAAVSANTGYVLAEKEIFLSPGHRRQHYRFPVIPGNDHFLVVYDRSGSASEPLLVRRMPPDH